MKTIVTVILIVFSVNLPASIEVSGHEPAKATSAEIRKNRSCFEELKIQGCGDPGDDIQHFRSCMNNSFELLSRDCRKMMSELYGTR